METVTQWTDHSFPIEAERRIIRGSNYGHYRPTEFERTPIYGLRRCRRGDDTSLMVLIKDIVNEPSWIHVSAQHLVLI